MFLLVIHISCYAWEAGLTTARINAMLAQLLTHRIIKLHIGTTLSYVIIIKSISTLMYTVWHVDKYNVTFKLVINWADEIL
jgi:hypothetical protein